MNCGRTDDQGRRWLPTFIHPEEDEENVEPIKLWVSEDGDVISEDPNIELSFFIDEDGYRGFNISLKILNDGDCPPAVHDSGAAESAQQ